MTGLSISVQPEPPLCCDSVVIRVTVPDGRPLPANIGVRMDAGSRVDVSIPTEIDGNMACVAVALPPGTVVLVVDARSGECSRLYIGPVLPP